MTTKTFANAPRPGSPEALLAFERGGPGHEPAKPQANISPNPLVHLHTEQQTHIPTKVPVRMKRLSIDMPASLHRRFKLACVSAEKLMVEEVLAFIERRTAELEG